MAGWGGFTEKDLERLKSQNEPAVPTSPPKISKVGQTQRKKIREKKIQPATKPVKDNEELVNDAKRQTFVDNQNAEKKGDMNELECQPNSIETTKEERCNVVLSTEKEDEQNVQSLEQLQLKQKVIEDQNKKKHALIKEALQNKFKQTKSESLKLMDIQKQLNRLDQTLQAAVEVLRNKIDEACMLFSVAQKRYEKSETEYVAAKLDFFEKKEQKESLTEHLYSIIQANEIRKAKKLEELMIKLSDSTLPLNLTPSEMESPSSPKDALSLKVDSNIRNGSDKSDVDESNT